MKMSQVPNLRVEDFPTEKEWIGRLFIVLNGMIQNINQIFDQNIDFDSNIRSLTRTYEITSFQAFKFSWPFPLNPPVSLTVLQASSGSQQTPTILMAAWEYDATLTSVSVTRMVELNSSSVSELSGRYKFTIRATI